MKQLLPLFAMTAALAAGQQITVSNASVQNVPASSGLDAAIRSITAKQNAPAWIGYTVAAIPGEHNSCCWNDSYRGCGLEGQRNVNVSAPSGPVKLEGPGAISVLLRVELGRIDKIRSFSIDCPLDAGGLPFYLLTDVKAAESVEMLARFAVENAPADNRKKANDSAVLALAMHAGPEAEAALQRLIAPTQPESVRKSAIFWLAQSRGKSGYQVVSRVLREDPSDKVREQAIFALTLSKEPGAIPDIIRAAKEDKTPHVRSQALFWLSQKASKQAAATITESIDRDPDTEVKKKAVFALSQLPKDEGVPLMIQVARTNANPAVRKQAMFWLGQSKDPRAIQFFEEVLVK